MRLGGPVPAQQFRLFEDGLGGFFLLIVWVSVPTQNALDRGAQLGAHAFFDGPVDGRISAHSLHKVSSDIAQNLVAHDFDGAAVD